MKTDRNSLAQLHSSINNMTEELIWFWPGMRRPADVCCLSSTSYLFHPCLWDKLPKFWERIKDTEEIHSIWPLNRLKVVFLKARVMQTNRPNAINSLCAFIHCSSGHFAHFWSGIIFQYSVLPYKSKESEKKEWSWEKNRHQAGLFDLSKYTATKPTTQLWYR